MFIEKFECIIKRRAAALNKKKIEQAKEEVKNCKCKKN